LIQRKVNDDDDEDELDNSEEVKALFKQYISALAGDKSELEEDKIEELSDEELDSIPCSTTKH
jgi:hypothetical protein